MSSFKGVSDQVRSQVRLGVKVLALVSIVGMILASMSMNSAAAARPPTATPINPTPPK